MTNGRTENRQVVKEISPNTLASARRNLQRLREVPVPPGPKRRLDFEAALDQLGDDRHTVRISGDQQNFVVLSMKLNASSIMAVAIIRIEKQRNNSPWLGLFGIPFWWEFLGMSENMSHELLLRSGHLGRISMMQRIGAVLVISLHLTRSS